MKRKSLLLLLILSLLLSFATPAMAQGEININAEVEKTANFMIQKVPEPNFGFVAGEWAILSLARSGVKLPDNYTESYYNRILNLVEELDGKIEGPSKKVTEYERLIVALTSIGKDITNVSGYTLLEYLGNIKHINRQETNGTIWALIAIDTLGFDIPDIGNPELQTSREILLEKLLNLEISGGGWSLMGDKADVDITAMALYSLAPYRGNPKVESAIERGINKLSEMQLATGGFLNQDNDENLESAAQTIIALTSLGVDPIKDSRFVKTDAQGIKHNLVEAILKFRSPDGGFKHVLDKETDGMATEQAMEALVALKRFEEGRAPLFDMTDVGIEPNEAEDFIDIDKNWAEELILKTKGFGISGASKRFKPNQEITRAEFAYGLVKGLGLNKGDKSLTFNDVSKRHRCYDSIMIASSLGVIEGRGDGNFDPNATITREEAMAIVQRALKTKGIGQEYTVEKANELLKKFPDGDQVSSWAKVPAAFNIDKKIIEGRPEGIVPKGNITRAEAVKVILTATDVK